MENFYTGENQAKMIENRAYVYQERDGMSKVEAWAKAYDELAERFQVPKLAEKSRV